MAEKPTAVLIVSGRGGVPTIPEKPQGAPGIQDCAEECTGSLYKHLGASFTPEAISAGHNTKGKPRYPAKAKVAEAFHEVYQNPPSTLKPGQSKSQRRKQMTAIALSKARRG